MLRFKREGKPLEYSVATSLCFGGLFLSLAETVIFLFKQISI